MFLDARSAVAKRWRDRHKPRPTQSRPLRQNKNATLAVAFFVLKEMRRDENPSHRVRLRTCRGHVLGRAQRVREAMAGSA